MDKLTLENSLQYYFNITLKNILNFHESYPSVELTPEFVNIVKQSDFFDLKDILVSNSKLVIDLKFTLTRFLSSYYLNLKSIKLSLGSGGIKLLPDYNSKDLLDLNLDSYVEIVSSFDSPEQIDNFCLSSKEMVSIFKKEELWRKLFKKVHNFLYKYDYNYERLYKSYLVYNNYSFNHRRYQSLGNVPIYRIISSYENLDYDEISPMREYIKFLLQEDLIDKKFLHRWLGYIIFLGEKDMFNMIYDKLKFETYSDDKKYSLRTSIDYPFIINNIIHHLEISLIIDNITFVKNFIDMELYKLIGSMNDFINVIKDLYDEDLGIDISLNMWNLLTHHIIDEDVRKNFNTTVIMSSLTCDNTQVLKEALKDNEYIENMIYDFVMDIDGYISGKVYKILKKCLNNERLSEILEDFGIDTDKLVNED